MTAVDHIHKYTFSDEPIALPEASYYVVDPCYVLGVDDQFWNSFCQFSFEGMPQGGVKSEVWMTVNDMPIYAFSTNYGDGCYPVRTLMNGEMMGKAGVDSGTLSFIPYSLVQELGQADRNLGVYVGQIEGLPEYDEGDVVLDCISVITSGENKDEIGFDEW